MTVADHLVTACIYGALIGLGLLFLDWATQGVIDAISDLTRFEEPARIPHSRDRGPTKANALWIACALVLAVAGALWWRWAV